MGRPSERKGAEEGGRSKSDREKAKCVWESFELRCIVGEQTVCLGGLRCGLMPAIGGGLPQLCVIRISGAGRKGREVEMEKVQTLSFWRAGDVPPLKDEKHERKVAVKNMKWQNPQNLHLHRVKLTRSCLNEKFAKNCFRSGREKENCYAMS